MTTARSSMSGYAPQVVVAPVEDHEQHKYEKMWENPDYRNYAPGEHAAQIFLQQAHPAHGETVIDFGAGTGRGALALSFFGGVKVAMLDFADNCLDAEIKEALTTQNGWLTFHHADIRKSIPVAAKYGYCTDVMEHIPPEDVDVTLKNILKAAQNVFFQICTEEDHFGATIGEHLHLTVRPYQWWLEQFRKLGVVILWSQCIGSNAMFYVSGWADVNDLVKFGTLNVEDSEIRANIEANIRQDVENARPWDRQDTPVMILAGGPSLNDFEDEIIQKRKDGMVMVTVNGAYNWALERGIAPSAQIIVDARESNGRFLEPAIENCRYMLASQCHPSLFEKVPKSQILLWHSAIDDSLAEILNNHYGAENSAWYPCIGGSTVMLRTLPLLRMLGYYRFEIYGMDSCIRDDAHHAYPQPENDEDGRKPVKVSCGDRIFTCTPWQASQAQEFIDLIRLMGDEIELDVKGDGLIAYIIEYAGTKASEDAIVIAEPS